MGRPVVFCCLAWAAAQATEATRKADKATGKDSGRPEESRFRSAGFHWGFSVAVCLEVRCGPVPGARGYAGEYRIPVTNPPGRDAGRERVQGGQRRRFPECRWTAVASVCWEEVPKYRGFDPAQFLLQQHRALAVMCAVGLQLRVLFLERFERGGAVDREHWRNTLCMCVR